MCTAGNKKIICIINVHRDNLLCTFSYCHRLGDDRPKNGKCRFSRWTVTKRPKLDRRRRITVTICVQCTSSTRRRAVRFEPAGGEGDCFWAHAPGNVLNAFCRHVTTARATPSPSPPSGPARANGLLLLISSMCTSNCDPVPTNDFLQDLGDDELSMDGDRLTEHLATAPRSTGPSAATACTLLCTVTMFTMTKRPFFRPSLWYTVRSSSTSSYVSSSDPSRNPPPAAAPRANGQNRALDRCPTTLPVHYPPWSVRGLWSRRADATRFCQIPTRPDPCFPPWLVWWFFHVFTSTIIRFNFI